MIYLTRFGRWRYYHVREGRKTDMVVGLLARGLTIYIGENSIAVADKSSVGRQQATMNFFRRANPRKTVLV